MEGQYRCLFLESFPFFLSKRMDPFEFYDVDQLAHSISSVEK
jgi:hypothetical protein